MLDDIAVDERFDVTSWRVDDAAVLWSTVGEDTSRALAHATRSFRDKVLSGAEPTPDQDPARWLQLCGRWLEQVDASLARSLRSVDRSAHPVIVVRGLAAGFVPPATPYDGVVDLRSSCQTIINLHAVLGCLGLHPIAYVGENTSTSHAVCPVQGARGEVSSHGFDAALPFHTDYADRPIDETVTDQSPAAAALVFGVERADPAVPMQCIPTRRLLSRLSAEQIRIGCAEEFMVRAPDLFGGGPAAHVRRLFLPNVETGFRCRLNLGKMTGLTPRASRLLNEIRTILSDEALMEQIHVRRGDVVVMDNQRTVHRRAAFVPRWDGTDRYFIRMSATRDTHTGHPADSRRPWVWS